MSDNYSTSETGHVKNLENFKRLYSLCERHQPKYNPVIEKNKLPNMQTLMEDAEAAHKNVLTTKGPVTTAINSRQALYHPLEQLLTRVIQSLDGLTEDKRVVKDVRGFVNKIRGKFSRPKTKDDQEGQETGRSVSNSQQSYDKLREHFENIIILLENVPEYVPNEIELRTETLRDYLLQLNDKEKEIIEINGPYNDALNERDRIFYETETSLKQVSDSVKSYLKSLFGIKSSEYAEAKKLVIRKIKRRK